MKNVLFLLLVIGIFSCKKDNPQPVSKTAPLLIEMTGNYAGEDIYCKVYLSEVSLGSEKYTTNSGTSITYTLNKPSFSGSTRIQFGSTSYRVSDDLPTNGSGSGINFTIKVTFNGQVLTTQTFNKGHGIYVDVNLPFVN